MSHIQTLVNETAPMDVSGPYLLLMPFADNVREIQLSSNVILMFARRSTKYVALSAGAGG